ncbi:MAG TPA: hypothetical protein VGW78_07205 [Candidatus Babeliales bacterium]|jgi:hypothetical protein|nr:hypothetical protein [Candidatus Babeliales bacterium]
MKKNLTRYTAIIVFSLFIATTTHILPMADAWNWIKTKLGYQVIEQKKEEVAQKKTIAKGESVVTIKEETNIGHLIFTITNVPYRHADIGDYATITIDADMCNQKGSIKGIDTTNSQEVINLEIQNDDAFLRGMFFSIQGALINYIAATEMCPKPGLLNVTIRPNDPGYTIARDAYSSLVKKLNKEQKLKDIEFIEIRNALNDREIIGGAAIGVATLGLLFHLYIEKYLGCPPGTTWNILTK